MPELDIRIVGNDDVPPWPELAPRVRDRVVLDRVAILQGGMVSGATSVAFLVADREGFVFAETSVALLRALLKTAEGAEARWADE